MPPRGDPQALLAVLTAEIVIDSRNKRLHFVASMVLKILAPCADLLAHELIAEPERIEPVARDGAVA